MVTEVPEKFIPLVFRLARAKKIRIVAGLVLLYSAVVVATLGALTWSLGLSLSLGLLLKTVGATGDGFAVALLMFSRVVGSYSADRYGRSTRASRRTTSCWTFTGL